MTVLTSFAKSDEIEWRAPKGVTEMTSFDNSDNICCTLRFRYGFIETKIDNFRVFINFINNPSLSENAGILRVLD